MRAAGLALLLSGCILDAETCGRGFVADDGRCVPAAAPPPFGEAGDGGGSEASRPEPDATLDDGHWGPFDRVRLTDRTAQEIAARDRSPGIDVDAVTIERDGQTVGVADAVLDVRAAPPATGTGGDAAWTLGKPDGVVFPLGGAGGVLELRLGLDRSLARGDVVRVHELDFGDVDRFEVELCTSADAACVALGVGAGLAEFPLQ